MKFSCPSCQAKYQIADEKVTGRSMKMKCRKCGAVIPVVNDASITDADVARLSMLPQSTPSMAPSAPVSAPSRAPAPPKPAAPSAAAVKPPAPSAVPKPAVGAAKPAAVPKPNAPKPAAATPKPAGVTPKPATAAAGATLPKTGAAARPAAASPLKSSASTSGLTAVKAPADPVITESQRTAGLLIDAPAPESAPPSSDFDGPPSLGRMASRAPAALAEWHAGIDGSAVGPLTREDLRGKLADGAVNKDTLVWRDGMRGWAALGEVPDLSDLLVPIVVPAPHVIAPASPTPAPRAALLPGPDPEELVTAQSAYDVAAISRESAPVPDVAMSVALAGSGARATAAEPDGYASSSIPPRDSIWARARARGPSKTALGLAFGGTLVFGLVMGFVIFGGQKTKIIKQIIEVPGQAAQGADSDIPAPPAEVAGTEPAAGTDSTTTGGTKVAGTAKPGSGTGATTPTTTAPAGDGGLKGLSGLQGLGSGGPQGGPAGTSAGTTSGQPLDASQIQNTVSQYQNNVKRACWQPALDTREKNAPSSARVTVSITVAGTGAVQGVSSTGDPTGYHGLASCIERRVGTWTFPRSSGQTTVKVPFVFAAQ